MLEPASPLSMANHLASYISDPSTIRVRVMEHFGRAPSLDQCRNLRQKKLNEAKQAAHGQNVRFRALFRCGHPESDDNLLLCSDGIDRCKMCADARQSEAEKRERARQERLRITIAKERAEREAINHKIEDAIALIVQQKPVQRSRFSTETLAGVARRFMLTVADLKGRDKHDIFVDARCAFALIMKERGASYPQIGRWINRDHSTVVNLIRKAPKRCARNPMILQAVAELR